MADTAYKVTCRGAKVVGMLFEQPVAPVMPRTASVADSLVTLASIDSTNAYARRMIETGALTLATTGEAVRGCDHSDAPGGDHVHLPVAVITADEQNDGHGRLGRRWMSHPGESFITSFVMVPPYSLATDPAVNGWLQMAAGIAVLDAVRGVIHDARPIDSPARLTLKWPNDIFCAGRKLGGILCELVPLPATTAGPDSRYAGRGDAAGDGRRIGIVIGVGLNLRIAADDLPIEQSTSLQLHWRGLPATDRMRDAIAADVVVRLSSVMRELTDEPSIGVRNLRARVIEHSYTLGRRVAVTMTDGTRVMGIATSVNEDASLTVRSDDGVEHIIRTADVGVLPL